MIPLMYILPTDNIFQSASGIITEITPKYSNFRDAIQIEFRYNLDQFFYLEILLSEFDQPQAVKLYSGADSYYSSVTDLEDEYRLVSDTVILILSKKSILDIVNNLATYTTFTEDMTIDLRVIKPQADYSARPVVSEVALFMDGLLFNINGTRIGYGDGGEDTGYEPVISGAFGGFRTLPYSAEFNFYFFDIDEIVPGHSLIIAPVKHFKNHYLFRGRNPITNIDLLESGTVQVNNADTVSVKNGQVTRNGQVNSFEKYINFKSGNEYKTYIFNAAYDKNLYTEISLLVPALKHNGMSIYDFESNTIVKGSIVLDVIIDPVTDMVMHRISMKNTRDFFNRPYPYTFEFIYTPSVVFSASKFTAIDNIDNLGMLYRTDITDGSRELIPLTPNPVSVNEDGLIAGSNRKIFASISRARISNFTKDRLVQNGLPKAISSSDSIHGIYSVNSIDYGDREIVVSRGTRDETFGFDDIKLKSIISSNGPSVILSETPSDFGGIVFKQPVASIDMDFVSLETYNDITLLTRVNEPADYGIPDIRKDCKDFVYHIFLEFHVGSVLIVFNFLKDKLYFIEYSRKVVNQDSQNLELVLDRLISVADERKLKDFLVYHSLSTVPSRIPGAAQLITSDDITSHTRRVESVPAINSDGTVARLSMIDGTLRDHDLILSGEVEGLYSPKAYTNSELVRSFKKTNFTYRPTFNGFFTSNNDTIVSADITGLESMSIVLATEDSEYKIDIAVNSGAFEFQENQRIDMQNGNMVFDSVYPIEISSTQSIAKIYQVFDAVVIEFTFGGRIAFIAPIISRMLTLQDLSMEGSISYMSNGYMVLAPSVAVTSFIPTSFVAMPKTLASTFFIFENNDIVLDIIPKVKMDYFLDEYAMDDDDSSFNVTTPSGLGLAIPIHQVKHYQFKEI